MERTGWGPSSRIPWSLLVNSKYRGKDWLLYCFSSFCLSEVRLLAFPNHCWSIPSTVEKTDFCTVLNGECFCCSMMKTRPFVVGNIQELLPALVRPDVILRCWQDVKVQEITTPPWSSLLTLLPFLNIRLLRCDSVLQDNVPAKEIYTQKKSQQSLCTSYTVKSTAGWV